MKNTYVEEAIRRAGGQVALAREIGVAQTTVSKWLHGETRPRIEHALRVEFATGVRAEYLAPDQALLILELRRQLGELAELFSAQDNEQDTAA